jgi:pseudaminic acid biosynthesis-associated methylase
MSFETEQEQFWAGQFGDEYAGRNAGPHWVASNAALFSRVLGSTRGVHSVLEVGANTGLNLRALRSLLPEADLAGLEINPTAAQQLRDWGGCEVYEESALSFTPARGYDLTFAKGVLIHINPERLADVYKLLVEASTRYVLVAEYYNPSPVAVPYRGHDDRLFKRDFAGEVMEAHGLRLVDYGFVYRRDPNFPQDDLTWFLMEKD